MRFLILFFCITLFHTYSSAQSLSSRKLVSDEEQQVRYISDELFIFLHAGPGRNFRIIGSINAGTAVSLLEVDSVAGYTQIQDERERTGWVESKFISHLPSNKLALAEASKQIKRQQEEIKAMQERMNITLDDFAKAEEHKSALNRNLTKILEQNAELERRIAQKGRSEQMIWFTRGTVLALISVVIGYFLGFFGRKKGKSNPLL